MRHVIFMSWMGFVLGSLATFLALDKHWAIYLLIGGLWTLFVVIMVREEMGASHAQ